MLKKYRIDDNKEFFNCKLSLIQKTFNNINSLFETHSVEKLYAMYKCDKQLYSRKCECEKILCSKSGYENHIKTCKVKPYIDEINSVKSVVSNIAEMEKDMLDLCEELILNSIVTKDYKETGNYICDCTRAFETRSGLWKHQKQCDAIVKIDIKKLKALLRQKFSSDDRQQFTKKSENINSVNTNSDKNVTEIDFDDMEEYDIDSKYICNCGKRLNSRQTLHTHKKICNGIDVKALQIKKLTVEMKETKKTLSSMQQVIDHMKSAQNKQLKK